MSMADHASGLLTIDLDAIAANWRLLRDRVAPAACAAVVKADAYGLGLAPVARRLAIEGCREFFVAQIGEAVSLAGILSGLADDAAIYVLNGFAPDAADGRAIPVLNTQEQAVDWSRHAAQRGRSLPVMIQIDTGMARLGMAPAEAASLAAKGALDGLDLQGVMSHLACAGEPEHPMCAEQLAAFRSARGPFPGIRGSLANSSGIFLGPDYHFDLARPGSALMGLAPLINQTNPMQQVVNLQGKILQVRHIDMGGSVGYGASHRVARPSRIATVAVGYADGYLRSLGNRGSAFIGTCRVPVVGRVSMDLITLDVTEAPEPLAQPGEMVDLIGPHNPPDALAAEAGTIGYEILTALGHRYARRYLGESGNA
ncbi:MAG: alanine racemase [Alphaproteobacteria bacterium]